MPAILIASGKLKGKYKNSAKFHIERSKRIDIPKIVRLVNDESRRSGAVLLINSSQVNGWIRNGFSLIAKAKSGEVAGHLSAYVWPGSGWIEIRSSVVKPGFRGRGISTALTRKMLRIIRNKYGKRTLVAFTNKAGIGQGILIAAGFSEADYDTLPKELFSIGPKYRGKKEYGYKIFVLDQSFRYPQ